jgi:hypothetical protein
VHAISLIWIRPGSHPRRGRSHRHRTSASGTFVIGAGVEAIAILSAIRKLTNPPAPKHRPIDFTADLSEKS